MVWSSWKAVLRKHSCSWRISGFERVKTLPQVTIALAEHSEDPALHALSVRSKAHWGYDAAFMAKAAPHLTLRSDWYAEGRVFAARLDDRPAGVAVVLPPDADGTADLVHLFVDPPFMGRGVGRALVAHALSRAREDGARQMTVLSDPFARGFYERLGARFLREEASDAIAGRLLPVLIWRVEECPT
jgi:GNAT superfamily N-acetyltransferase